MTKKKSTGEKRVQREARLAWIPLGKMRVSPIAQREFKQYWADYLYANFDLEKLNNPTVNARDGWYYIVNGQHSIDAARRALDLKDDDVMQCWTYEGLSENEEAELFLALSETLSIQQFDKFRIAIAAGRPEEIDIDRIVRANGLRVSRDKGNGAISAVGTLRRVYRRGGPLSFGRTLRIIRDAYGDAGLESIVIDGVGLLCHRYNGDFEDEKAIKQLSSAHAGVNGLLNRAEQLRNQTGNPKAHCVAAAAVELVNRGKGGPKLPSWWRAEDR